MSTKGTVAFASHDGEVTEGDPAPAPEPLPDAPNAQFAGGNGLGQVIVSMPRTVMTRPEALAHAAWLVEIAGGAEEFARYLQAVRSTC